MSSEVPGKCRKKNGPPNQKNIGVNVNQISGGKLVFFDNGNDVESPVVTCHGCLGSLGCTNLELSSCFTWIFTAMDRMLMGLWVILSSRLELHRCCNQFAEHDLNDLKLFLGVNSLYLHGEPLVKLSRSSRIIDHFPQCTGAHFLAAEYAAPGGSESLPGWSLE